MKNLLKSYCDKNDGIFRNYGYQRNDGGGYVNAILVDPNMSPRGLIVFAHATGNDCSFPQASMFEFFLDAGYSVFSFDLDGHGRESSTLYSSLSIRTCLDQAIEVASAIDPELPLHLVGQSLGGALVIDYLAGGLTRSQGLSLGKSSELSHPRNPRSVAIRSATVIGVPLYINQSHKVLINELLSLKSMSLYPAIVKYGAWGVLPALGSFKRNQFPIRLSGTSSDLERHTILGSKLLGQRAWSYLDEITLTLEQINIAEACKDISVPLMLCYGELDMIAPIDHGESVYENTKVCSLMTVFGETHFTLGLSEEVFVGAVKWIEGCT